MYAIFVFSCLQKKCIQATEVIFGCQERRIISTRLHPIKQIPKQLYCKNGLKGETYPISTIVSWRCNAFFSRYKVIFPYVWHPLKNVVTSGCVFMVVAVATERYFAICKPLFVKPRPSFFITLVVVSSITINVPKFFEFNHIYDENNTLQYWTSDLNENANYVVFSSYYECAVIGVIPLLALCYLNYKIYIGISKSAKSMIRHTGGTTSTISTTADSRNSSLCRTNNLRVQHHRNGQAEQVPLLLMGKFSNKKATPETPANLPQNRLSFVDQNPNGISRSQSSPRE